MTKYRIRKITFGDGDILFEAQEKRRGIWTEWVSIAPTGTLEKVRSCIEVRKSLEKRYKRIKVEIVE